MTYSEKLKLYAQEYREHKENAFWLNMKKDLREISDDFKVQSLIALKGNKPEDAQRLILIAEGIDLAIDRPEFVLKKTSSIVFETCETCGRVWSKAKRFLSGDETDLTDSVKNEKDGGLS